MNANRFLLGFSIFGIGLLSLGSNLGYVDPTFWTRLFVFWPMVVILIGLRFIIKNNLIMTFLGSLLITSAFAAVVYLPGVNPGIGFSRPESTTQKIVVPKQEGSQTLNVTINTGAVELVIGKLPTDLTNPSLLSVEAENMSTLQLDEKSTGNDYNIVISEKGTPAVNGFAQKRKLTIFINPTLPVVLDLNVGASAIKADLEELTLSRLVFRSGATSASFKLGELSNNIVIDIQSGVSDFEFMVPKSLGLKVEGVGGLSRLTLPERNATLNLRDSFQTEGYTTSQEKVDINLRSGLSNIEIIRY